MPLCQIVQRLSFSRTATWRHFWKQDFSLFFINIWVYAIFLRKAYHVDNEDWKTSCSKANMYCDLKFAGCFFFFINIWVYAVILRKVYHNDNEDWKTSCSKVNLNCDLKFAGCFFFLYQYLSLCTNS